MKKVKILEKEDIKPGLTFKRVNSNILYTVIYLAINGFWAKSQFSFKEVLFIHWNELENIRAVDEKRT